MWGWDCGRGRGEEDGLFDIGGCEGCKEEEREEDVREEGGDMAGEGGEGERHCWLVMVDEGGVSWCVGLIYMVIVGGRVG